MGAMKVRGSGNFITFTPHTTSTTSSTWRAPEIDHVAEAGRCERVGRDTWTEVRSMLAAARALGWRMLVESLEEGLDQHHDAYVDAVLHQRDALQQRDKRIARLTQRTELLNELLEESRAVLRTAALDADRRAKRSGAALAAWVVDAVGQVPDLTITDGRVVVDEEPF